MLIFITKHLDLALNEFIEKNVAKCYGESVIQSEFFPRLIPPAFITPSTKRSFPRHLPGKNGEKRGKNGGKRGNDGEGKR